MPAQTAVSPVFVGRTTELAALTGVLARAEAGSAQTVLLGGEAGVGKTRLLEEFRTAVHADGATVSTGGCLELGADGLPFAPFSTALRGLRRALGGPALAAAGAGREAELARLLPDLAPPAAQRDDEEEGEGGYGTDGGRARLFEAAAQFLERLAADRTVVVVLEDLQWADSSTRELLGYLFRSVRDCRLVLLASYRTDDIHRRHPLRPFLAEQDRLRTVVRLGLPRLTRAEVRSQIAGIQGVERPDEELADAVYRRSEGIPFFVEELTATCADRTISDSLRDLLLVRAERLPESAQRVVRLAAAGGSAVEHALLAAVAGLTEDDLLEALRAAVGGNVLRPTEDGAGYRFRHALLREAVAEDLLPGERARISRRYAEALAADPTLVRAEERAARLAAYWYRARDAAKALPAALAASTAARRRHAYAEEHQLLERALELWDEVPEEDRSALPPLVIPRTFPAAAPPGPRAPCEHRLARAPRLAEVLAEAVVAARTGGETERAFTLTRRALAGLDEAKEPLTHAWFQLRRAVLTEDLGRGDGWAEIAAARELVRGLPPSAVHAEVLAMAANWGLLHRPGRDALGTAVRAVELARVVGARAIELEARVTLGMLLSGSGDLEQGLAEMAAARDAAEEAGVSGVQTFAAVNIAVELEAAGRSVQAAAEAERAAGTAAARGRRHHHASALAARAEALLSLGDGDGAARLADEAHALTRAVDVRAWSALLRARLACERGDRAALERAVRDARAVLGGSGVKEPAKAVPLRHAAMALAAERGDFETARAELGEALTAGFGPGTHPYAWPLLYAATAAEAELRGLPAAEPGRAEVLTAIRYAARHLRRGAPVWEAYGLLVEAELTRAEGAPDPAAWTRAVRAFAPLDRPYPLALARLRLAEALLDAGRAGDGAAPEGVPCARDVPGLLHAAYEAAVRLEAAPLRLAAERLAARGRLAPLDERAAPARALPHAPTDPADSFGLTRRERDVLALVAEGHSNRRIAEHLHIAPKTASVHVSNILGKLGVTSRGEAAAMTFRLRLLPAPDALPGDTDAGADAGAGSGRTGGAGGGAVRTGAGGGRTGAGR